MKTPADLARGWMLKADSDLRSARACLAAGSPDTACFHCQQTAEKSLKAFLIFHSINFPFTHDLGRLIALCGQKGAGFHALLADATSLNPYAVEMRYDDEFWPSPEEVAEQLTRAEASTTSW
jgi:HEPN domain-containing protein